MIATMCPNTNNMTGHNENKYNIAIPTTTLPDNPFSSGPAMTHNHLHTYSFPESYQQQQPCTTYQVPPYTTSTTNVQLPPITLPSTHVTTQHSTTTSTTTSLPTLMRQKRPSLPRISSLGSVMSSFPPPASPTTATTMSSQSSSTSQPQNNSASPSSRVKGSTRICSNCFDSNRPCDGQWPCCSGCMKQGLTCAYATGVRKRGPRAGYSKYLTSRIRELEGELKKKAVKTTPAMAKKILEALARHHQEHDSDMEEDSESGSGPSERDTMSLHENVESFGPSPVLPSSQPVNTSATRVVESSRGNVPAMTPASPSFRYDLLYAFLEHFHSRLGLFEDHLLMDLISIKPQNEPLSTATKPQLVNPFFETVVYAIGSAFLNAPPSSSMTSHSMNDNSIPERERFYQIVMANMTTVLLEPCLFHACGLYLFSIFAAGQGKRIDAEMAFISSLRMCQTMGLFSSDTLSNASRSSWTLSGLSPAWERELGKRLVWNLYELDRIFSLQSGLPFAIQFQDLLCGMPNKMKRQDTMVGRSQPMGHVFSARMGILSILSDIVDYLQKKKKTTHHHNRTLPQETEKIQQENQNQIMKFEAMLRNWFDTLPPWMQHMSHYPAAAFPSFRYSADQTSSSGSDDQQQQQLFFSAATCLVFYSYCFLCLYGKEMLRAIQRNRLSPVSLNHYYHHQAHHQQEQNKEMIHEQPSVRSCLFAAHLMTRILETILERISSSPNTTLDGTGAGTTKTHRSNGLSLFPPYLEKCIFSGAVIHLLSLGCEDRQTRVGEHVVRALNIHTRALEKMAFSTAPSSSSHSHHESQQHHQQRDKEVLMWLPAKSSLSVLEHLIKGCIQQQQAAAAPQENTHHNNNNNRKDQQGCVVSLSSSIFHHSDQLEAVFSTHLL